MTADVGDVVTAYGQSYKVVEIDCWNQYVCRNLNPGCMAYDELRTFVDADLDAVVKKDSPELFQGQGI